jgi:hypothetical protein
MIQQLIKRLVDAGQSPIAAANAVLGADPLDLVLHAEQVWEAYLVSRGSAAAGPARRQLSSLSAFNAFIPADSPAWDHLGYSYVLENSRVIQILYRVLREYRFGESLGIPSPATQRWLLATETLLFGAANPIAAWLATSTVRPDAEAVRRNAYWRLFGLDLAFGTEDNRPPSYVKATAANTSFVRLFEELLFEVWQAISNVRNTSGVNASDDDRIFRIAQELKFILSSRRQDLNLDREELAAATALGWAELSLSFDTPVVIDLKAQATSAADRLRLIGERVGLPAHSRSAALLSMSGDLSVLLRALEGGLVDEPTRSWVLYLETQPPGAPPGSPAPLGKESRRVITEWAAATGKDLKARARPIEIKRPPALAIA